MKEPLSKSLLQLIEKKARQLLTQRRHPRRLRLALIGKGVRKLTARPLFYRALYVIEVLPVGTDGKANRHPDQIGAHELDLDRGAPIGRILFSTYGHASTTALDTLLGQRRHETPIEPVNQAV